MVLVSGPTALSPPARVGVVRVVSAKDMAEAICGRLAWATVVVMAAAVADFRPVAPSVRKIKKTSGGVPTLILEPTDDILRRLAGHRTSQILVGFAAETESVVEFAQEKLREKRLDLIVGNNVMPECCGFGSDTSAAVLIDRHGGVVEVPVVAKRVLADRILDKVLMLPPRPSSPVHASA